jgi:hypothetical protein
VSAIHRDDVQNIIDHISRLFDIEIANNTIDNPENNIEDKATITFFNHTGKLSNEYIILLIVV